MRVLNCNSNKIDFFYVPALVRRPSEAQLKMQFLYTLQLSSIDAIAIQKY